MQVLHTWAPPAAWGPAPRQDPLRTEAPGSTPLLSGQFLGRVLASPGARSPKKTVQAIASLAARPHEAGRWEAAAPCLRGGPSPPHHGAAYFGNRLGLAAGAGVGDS